MVRQDCRPLMLPDLAEPFSWMSHPAARHVESPRHAAPVIAVDAVLAAALRTGADAIWIEPSPLVTDRYVISLESGGTSLSTTTVSSAIGCAMIVRLARIAEVELPSTPPATGVVTIRSDTGDARLVLTVRPGTDLRAEVLVISQPRPRLGVANHNELKPGEHVGHYRILSKLGAGGMGCVYVVEHATLERRYALKVLHHNKKPDPLRTDRFLREARAAARLRHPSIVDVFDFGYLPDQRPYFVMELLEGASVEELVAERPLPANRAVAIATELAGALAMAHDNGVIHADISASNVLVIDGSERVKLLDFGLSEMRQSASSTPQLSDMVCGTPAYIAPERIRGYPADETSDQYSFGALLYVMLTGKLLFETDTVDELLHQQLSSPAPVPVSPLGPLPEKVLDIVARMLAKNPAARYPSMRAVHADLLAVARRVERQGWRRWLP